MSVLLEWSPTVIGDSQKVYRSTSTFNHDNLPSILATIGASDHSYDDTTATNETYFYAIETILGTRSILSSVEKITHTGAAATDTTFDLTIASAKVGSDLSNYPIVVDLSLITDSAWWADVARSDGGDIRVFDNADTALPFDLIDIDTTLETGVCVVRGDVATASSTTIKFVAYNDVSMAPLAASDTNGQHDTWQDFEAVYLLRSDLADRTSNARDLTARTGTANYTTTFAYGLGGGIDNDAAVFDATHVDATLAGITGTMMVACGLVTDTASNQYAFSTMPTAGNNTGRYGLGEEHTPSRWSAFSTATGFLTSSVTCNAGSDAILHSVVESGNAYRLSVDGVLEVSSTTTTRLGQTIMLGAIEGSSDSSWRGDIGMAYLRSDIVSADWIAADFENFDLSKTLFR